MGPNIDINPSALNRLEYVCWKMKRDAKRRQMVKDYSFERTNHYAIRKNDILPQEIKVILKMRTFNNFLYFK